MRTHHHHLCVMSSLGTGLVLQTHCPSWCSSVCLASPKFWSQVSAQHQWMHSKALFSWLNWEQNIRVKQFGHQSLSSLTFVMLGMEPKVSCPEPSLCPRASP